MQDIQFPQAQLKAFCKKHHILKLSLFGSALRPDFSVESDVDILVEFEKGHEPSFFSLFEMENEISRLLNGRRADIRTAEDLSRHFRPFVLKNLVVKYAA